MKRDLNIMKAIQSEKAKEIEAVAAHKLDPEGKAMSAHKRFTFDIIDTPIDPLR